MRASKEGYPWLFSNSSRSRMLSLLVTLAIIGITTVFFFWYKNNGSDPTPDSALGYSFAFAGTTFMLIAFLRYSIYRRSRKRGVGKLNASLNWHISLGFIAFALLVMHSFGNFNPRTGTWALWGMIAMVISGLIGRMLDHMMPRFITGEALKALTKQGEDRVESITKELQNLAQYNKQEVRGFRSKASQAPQKKAAVPAPIGARGSSGQSLQTPWDLAYISLEETPQEVSRDNEVQYRFVPDRKSVFERPGVLMPGVRDHMRELQTVEGALKNEQVFRYITRYWRVLHVFLAIATVVLTLWHLEFALSLLIPVWLGR